MRDIKILDMEQPREMNLFDLCAAFGRMIGRAVKSVFCTIGSWIRLSLRKWWIVLPIVGAMVSLALYYSREDNRAYKVTAVAIINGATRHLHEKNSSVMSGAMTFSVMTEHLTHI